VSSLCVELHYLPSVVYFSAIVRAETVWIEAHEHFQKQTYRNRCHINTANGTDTLIVPVIHHSDKMRILDVRVDYQQNWVNRHWGALKAAYGKAPFFDYFADEFDTIYRRKPAFLFELNCELLTICLKLMKVQPTLRQTEAYQKELPSGQFDARATIHPKRVLGNNFFYQPVVYQQNFGTQFVPNLSIIDLLMCQGPAAKGILQASMR
jgi:WbqC-like protein family